MIRSLTSKIYFVFTDCNHVLLMALATSLSLLQLPAIGQEVIPELLYSNNDGPYVSYTADSIIVKSIVTKKGVRQVEQHTYALKEKANIELKITFSEKPSWNFNVKLRSSITNEQSVWEQPAKLLAISDIEGQFGALRSILIANHVIDKKYKWIFGNGHVVICGDLFDRGSYVTEELWLLYKLEQDAKANGGYFHSLLGNHDIMNLSGDLRYVQPKYFDNAKLMGLEYNNLLTVDTELGRWLRSKNIIEKIGENICVHGGVSPQVNQLQLPIETINNRSRPYYDKADTDEPYADSQVNPFFSDTTSPFWYRGYFVQPRATQAQVDSTLSIYNCKAIIVGHTIAPPNVAAYYQNKVIGVDVNHHAGKHEGVIIENGAWYKINTTGKKKLLFTSR